MGAGKGIGWDVFSGRMTFSGNRDLNSATTAIHAAAPARSLASSRALPFLLLLLLLLLLSLAF
jgi:hypothetical protein